MANPSEYYSAGLQQMQYNPSFFSLPQQQQSGPHHVQMQPNFNQSQASLSNRQMLNHSHALSDMMVQQDPLGRSLQELDISKGFLAVKSENSSVSASESSSTM